MKNVSSKLLEAFKSSGFSYGELTKTTGIHKSALHRYFSGQTPNIPLDRLEAICAALCIDTAELLGWVKEEQTADQDLTPEQKLDKELEEALTGLDAVEIMRVLDFIAGIKSSRK